ncbi:hypothetical protein MT344_01310 [Clavibacter michiganensis subsp. phaseoli]|uniref:hypothetical protein n=1 Tax=Clavibacter phaseoli TaxID=1734031 RepID=UPI001FB32C11|nr:hypothetical protein [Clavibacter phaseoli]MCJ1709819.1 hypothetical protein [Clavibacter phaseoli]
MSDHPHQSVPKSALRWAGVKLVFFSLVALENVQLGLEGGNAIHWGIVGLAALLVGYNGWLVSKATSRS